MLNNVGSGTASVSTTTANGANLSGATPILGGYAVVNGTDWATVGAGGSIAAVSSAAYSNGNGSNAWAPPC